MIRAKIVNVIEVQMGNEISYHTLEGVAIGGLNSGQRIEPIIEKKEVKPQGGIVVAPKPQEVRREKEIEVSKMIDAQERIRDIPR